MLASIYVKQCFKSVDRKREIVVDYDNLVTDVAKSKKKELEPSMLYFTNWTVFK